MKNFFLALNYFPVGPARAIVYDVTIDNGQPQSDAAFRVTPECLIGNQARAHRSEDTLGDLKTRAVDSACLLCNPWPGTGKQIIRQLINNRSTFLGLYKIYVIKLMLDFNFCSMLMANG